MSFDKTQPAPNISLRLSNPLILANWAALEDALGREHDFPGTMGSIAGQHKYLTLADQESDPETPASGKSILYAKSGLPYQRNSAGTVIRVMIGEGGGETKCWFGQNVSPTGWTIDATAADCLIGVKGGTGIFDVDGGSDAGSWDGHTHDITTSDHVHAGPDHNHTTGNVTLTAAQSGRPAATITIGRTTVSDEMWSWENRASFAGNGEAGGVNVTIPAANASQAHNHGATGSAGTGNTSSAGGETVTSTASPDTDRPKSRIGIICSLN